MKKEKRFFWLKLSENIFDENPIVFNLPGGNDAFRLYIELCLKAINSNGVLIFSKKISIFSSLSALTKMDEKIVKQSLKLLIKFDLINKKDNFILEINNFYNMIGSVSKSALRMRKMRLKNKDKDKSLSIEKKQVNNVTLERNNVRNALRNSDAQCDADLGREKENIRDREIEIRDRYSEAEASLDAEAKASAIKKSKIEEKLYKKNFNIADAIELLQKDELIPKDKRQVETISGFMELISKRFPSIVLFQAFFIEEILPRTKKSKPRDFLRYFSQLTSHFFRNPSSYDVGKKILGEQDEMIRIAQTPWVVDDFEEIDEEWSYIKIDITSLFMI